MGTIDSFTWTTITDGRIDPNSPLDTTLTTDIRDNLENLMRWLGKDFLGGQVANHDHNGTNTKKIDASNITNLTSLSEWIWEDDGDLLFNDASTDVGSVSISGAVPVDTYAIMVWIEVRLSDALTDLVAFREVGIGTYREVFKSDLNNSRVSSSAMVPVDSSRNIDRSTTAGGTGLNVAVWLRLYQTS